MKAIASLVVAAAAVTLAAPASAQFAKPEDAIKYRQSALFVMGQHFSRLGAMANGRVPFDAKAAADNAEVVADMSKLPWAGFAPGTDKAAPTKAKPEVWAEQAKFKDYNEKLVAETTKLAAAAKTGNLDNLKVAFSATAGACKTCHDAFRSQ
ncbi:c-type cytochrome [Variovorax terrae]|uniref:Cytochrome c n=1 Tax=Variovorax terrae TaxID=2923278 RepID=A0A9X1VWL4_9BURK|nr:cytochrome c [Variovorax terrae]MCJ0764589.1 cytochrome c [Variovorax terrae]